MERRPARISGRQQTSNGRSNSATPNVSNWRDRRNRLQSRNREDNEDDNRQNDQRIAFQRDSITKTGGRQHEADNSSHHQQFKGRPRSHTRGQGNTSGNGPSNKNTYNKIKFIGFLALEEMAKSDVKDIILKINEKRDAFLTFVQTPNDKPDVFVLIMKILSKITQSSFDELKLKLILDISNSNFIKLFMIYMINLPYDSPRSNGLYWKNQEEFWLNFVMFCECLVNIAPLTALKNCRSLIDATSKSCIDGLRDKHEYIVPEEYTARLVEVQKRLAIFEEMGQEPQRKCLKGTNEYLTPPDDFRSLSIIPNRDDLIVSVPFVRPNIVDGAYQDVEHYLDVQFRLLREDCYGPLRDGINQYMNDTNKKRYDHIRVFHNVRFIQPYVSHTKVGSVIQIDIGTNRLMKTINWAHSKRFIFGSLVLFTRDNCKSFITATILDRDPRELSKGRVPVSIIGDTFDEQLYKSSQLYTMIESEVYFEPYYHVLKVLQDPKFPTELPLQQYIVSVQAISKHPSYLSPDEEFTIYGDKHQNRNQNDVETERENPTMNIEETPSVANQINICKFKVLKSETWPDKNVLEFNESQYEAYKLALTHEFAVIQGPPGTGKTYLGIKIAKTILQNITKLDGGLMLIVCYTNHALDQFLEAILKFTNSVARIGGQSRNKTMETINVNQLRKATSNDDNANKLFLEQRFQLKSLVSDLKKAQIRLDVLTNGVISYNSIRHDVREIDFLGTYYREIGITDRDPLKEWLFDYNSNDYWLSLHECLLDEKLIEVNNFVEDEKHKRTEFLIDDEEGFDDIGLIDLKDLKASFSLNDTKSRLKDSIKEYKEKKQNNHRDFHNIGVYIQQLTSQIMFYNAMKEQSLRNIDIRVTEATNFSRIRLVDRWCLYFKWIEHKVNQVKEEILQLQTTIMPQMTAFEESRMVLDLQVLRGRNVIGMTTSGAARMRKLLRALSPLIVIVEEAAEVLEQHIITSLTEDCQHLILIGDHQQLRPSASHMKLARDFDIEVSLFERMIKNGIHSRRLDVQHRMRPEIASLISPHIYPDIENHPSVEDFPNVLGMDKNVFFFTHQFEEEANFENLSKSNQKEGEIVVALANYLMQQGYCAEDITILTGYSGQMFSMKKERDKYPHLLDVKITVVDNYQGEEAKIILLSLVRNNKDGKIGFLGTENRICVALSRAREGFYMFGNMDMLKSNSALWTKIANTLDRNYSIGTAIKLKCRNHPENVTNISKVEDFVNVPEGGCMQKCDFIMRCGHKCPLLCHGYDRPHTAKYTRCRINCEKIICELNHKCPLKCWEDCPPCNVLMEKTLPCGHNMQVFCHKDPEDESIKCLTTTMVTLTDCGHEAKKLCFQDLKDVKCQERCEYRVPKCGHACMRMCHVNSDPNHKKYECRKYCARAKKGCRANLEGDRGSHQCQKLCWEECDDCNVMVVKKRSNCKHVVQVTCHKNPDETRCYKNCAKKLSCGHFCKKKCFDNCGDCFELVIKVIPDCNHKIRIACKNIPTRELCKEVCNRILSCGHKCKQLCGADCDSSLCIEKSSTPLMSPCGHMVAVPCNLLKGLSDGTVSKDCLLKHCSTPCHKVLECTHVCGGTCAKCYQGRLHRPCLQKCNQLNICGHVCEEPCNQICPPCDKQCEVRCQHSRCNDKCSVPCSPCQEKCSRKCPHRACSRRCGESCDVAPCAEPCPLRLPCKHPCRGVCGEPCPPICQACRPDQFPVDFLGDPYPDDAMFILLQDCKHVLELEEMDTLMLGNAESINIRACPFCRKPIINTNRYKDIVNKTFKEYINPIKIRVYGNPNDISRKNKEVLDKIQNYARTYSGIIKAGIQSWISAFKKLLHAVSKSQQKKSLIDLEMLLVCHNILDMISTFYKKYSKYNSLELNDKINEQIELICGVLVFKNNRGSINLKISQQQQVDVGNELKRLDAMMQFSVMLDHRSYKSTKTVPEVVKAVDEVRSLVFSCGVYKSDECKEVLQRLQKAINVSGVVSKEELQLVVKAMNMKSGHWYRCPNGHLYCIGECGGAVEVGACVECKKPVGGTSHSLLPSNSHAGDVDGSRFPAYSEQANNLANFELDII